MHSAASVANPVQLNGDNRGLREGKENSSRSLKVEPVWRQGYTGKDIVVGIVYDGKVVD